MGLLSIIFETLMQLAGVLYITAHKMHYFFCFLCYKDNVFTEELVSDNICAC